MLTENKNALGKWCTPWEENSYQHHFQDSVINKEIQILHLECGTCNTLHTLLGGVLLAKAIYFSENVAIFPVIACQTAVKLVN